MSTTQQKLIALIDQHKWREVAVMARQLQAECEAIADEENEREAAPVCRICGKEGHRWQRCGSM